MSVTQLLQPDGRGIQDAAQLLRDGQLVAFPTETVYGLGADACSALVELPVVLHDLAQAFWPGPLTLVAPLRSGTGLSELVSAGLPTVAVRVPANPLAKARFERSDRGRSGWRAL